MTETTDLPELPHGYKWEMLHQCPHDIPNTKTGGKWIVRVSWLIKGSKRRMLNLVGSYFMTREDAIEYGVTLSRNHAEMRRVEDAG